MRIVFRLGMAGAALLMAFPQAHAADKKVGEAVQTSTRVAGHSGELRKGSPIHRDERIRTNASGAGSFMFDDGTKLAIGPNSSVVIDQYVHGGGNTAKTLAISAAKGTFRWISGKSSSSAYRIDTPSGTLGVRGTAFDVYVGADGLTAVVLLNGKAEFCNASGCQQLQRRCDYLIAKPDGQVSKPRGVVRQLGDGQKGEETFPFLAGRTPLARGFKGASSCEGLPNLSPRFRKRGSEENGSNERSGFGIDEGGTGGGGTGGGGCSPSVC
jgi:hypothetical protein